jgi:hypothetical protein
MSLEENYRVPYAILFQDLHYILHLDLKMAVSVQKSRADLNKMWKNSEFGSHLGD